LADVIYACSIVKCSSRTCKLLSILCTSWTIVSLRADIVIVPDHWTKGSITVETLWAIIAVPSAYCILVSPRWAGFWIANPPQAEMSLRTGVVTRGWGGLPNWAVVTLSTVSFRIRQTLLPTVQTLITDFTGGFGCIAFRVQIVTGIAWYWCYSSIGAIVSHRANIPSNIISWAVAACPQGAVIALVTFSYWFFKAIGRAVHARSAGDGGVASNWAEFSRGTPATF
jgi:hypothetical protein